ncbi:restriction endonuclease subunit S [Helicobacter mustelae]|uniref:Type I restriction-modification methylase n=1 Tax=Helicobacter mustelae (strain ATCC 43772 / CCUG 25715 / CIP 103759 / LMG 18044 / NCTC 12198 / R85-136P) TaxID=679897 RepID=D3UHW3_HELM1|nr:restriction endonuclease subunit S [Helicobacter mustelae]CBG40086.1 type I restriction-modification methylase [Helicobacter mustelae 12198]SQH71600.1 type I restriction-modification methylase [Helicobacter mustelae]
MNRFEKLLQTLCPHGVEFRKLGEVINICKGKQLNKEFLSNYGEYPVMNGGIYASGYWNTYNTNSPKIIISQGGASAGYVNYMTSKFWAGAHCYVIESDSKKVNYKFLFYFLKNKESFLIKSQFGAGIPALNKADIETLPIPLPPLEVQREIVKILDTFTELNTELNTELKLRKKQYEYYRNWLLSFSDVDASKEGAEQRLRDKSYPKALKALLLSLCPHGVEFRKLGEVGEFQKGATISKKNAVPGEVPVIAGGRQPAYYHNHANRIGETIAISSSGAYAGYVSYWNIPVFLSDSFSISPKKENLIPKYLFYWLQVKQDAIYATKSTGGIPHVYSKNLDNLPIPLPPLEVQREIVKILDDFSTLTEDLSSGIPAEIAARKKQYEYYRDKLLTFTPLIKEGE